VTSTSPTKCEFEDRGDRELKGIGTRRLFAVL